MDNQTTDNKKKKSKGPIRIEAVLPVAIIMTLIYIYFAIFFDIHLRSAIEWTAGRIHGAEVNISKIKTSVFKGYFKLYGLQITDKEKPERNLLQISQIHFDLLWDALLRAKFVIDEASIESIQIYAPRKSPGRVDPKESKNASVLGKIEQGVMNQAKSQFNKNILGDVANIIDGTDPSAQLKNIQTNLKAHVKIKELQKELKIKEKIWNERIKKLIAEKEFKALITRGQKLKFDLNNPAQIVKSIKDLDQILKEVDQKVKAFQSASHGLTSDVNHFNNTFKGLEDLAQNDLNDLQKRFKIPDINMTEFSMGLLGHLFFNKVASVKKYMAVGREYMPSKKSGEKKEEVVPSPRGQGKNIHFPITTGYPFFWLKKARISSKASSSKYNGNIEGQITDVTSNPIAVGRPMIATLKGDFPEQYVMGLDIKLTVDHTQKDNPYEKLIAKINSYPIGGQSLTESDDVKFNIKGAQGQIKMDAILRDQKIKISVFNSFKNVDYDVSAKSPIVNDILTGVVKDLLVIDVTAVVTGTWERLNWHMSSNLGHELSRGFKKQIDAKVNEAKKKLKAFIDGKIKNEKDKLTVQFNKAKSKIMGQLDKKKAEVSQAKQQAQNSVKSKKKKAQSSGKKNLEKEGKKLLKNLGF